MMLGNYEKALEWMRGMIPRLEVAVAERAVCEADRGPRQHRSATEILATIKAALPELEARAAAEAAQAMEAAQDDGKW